MSLIHEALKKAQSGEGSPQGSALPPSFQEPVEEKKPPTRVIVLGVALLLAMGLYAYFKLSGGTKAPQVPQTSQATTVQPLPGAAVAETDIVKIKKKSLDAFTSGDYETAFSTLSAAIQAGAKETLDDPEVWNNLGVIAKKKGDVAKAREAYTKALELKPEYPEALNNMSVLEMQAGNTTKAKELLSKSLTIAPANPEANFHMAVLLEQQGDKKNAIEYYKRFVSSASGFPSSTVDAVRDHVMEIEP